MKNYLRLNVTLTAFLLIPLLSNSQVLLDSNSVKTVRKVFIERNLYRDRANELLIQLDSCAVVANKTIEKKNRVIESQKSLLRLSDEIITTDSLQILDLNKSIAAGNKKMNFLKAERTVLGIGLIVVLVKLLL